MPRGMETRSDAAGDVTCVWQADTGLCAAVLHEVFQWLEARALCAASATCRAWRRAAAAPPLWRRLLQLDARLTPTCLRALNVSWREEYVRTFAGWERIDAQDEQDEQEAEKHGQHEQHIPGQVGARHAALSPGGRRLALVSEYAEITIWQRSEEGARGWTRCWSESLSARGWASAERSTWAETGGAGAGDRGGARLLVAGALALVDSWELIVVELDVGGAGRLVSRARCSAGAGGCWARGDQAFLSLELRSLAPRVACTTVWLNAATQETASEYAGVASPLLRIYSEGGDHITLAAVAEVPLQEEGSECAAILLAGSGVRAETGALRAWGLPALQPAPLLASSGGELATRIYRRATAPTPQPPRARSPPAEDAVRAICTPPDYACSLPAPPVGMVLHRSGRCAWVSLGAGGAGGACCAALPTLQPLRYLAAPALQPALALADQLLLHYVQPALTDSYFASPAGSMRGEVCVWSTASGAACPAPRAPRHPRAPVAAALALLPPAPAAPPLLLVLAGGTLHVWRSRATRQPTSTATDGDL